MAAVPPPPVPAVVKKKDFNKTPQELVSEFWDKYFTKKPGKVTSIFPRSLYETLLPPSLPRDGAHSARNAAESYETAARECRDKVKRIIRECNRTNEKFTDPDFDIESDWNNNCLNGLIREDPWEWMYDSDNENAGGDDDVEFPGPISTRGTRDGPVLPDEEKGKGRPADKGGDGQARSRKAQGKGGLKSSQSRRHGVKCGEMYNPGSIHRLDWIFDSPKFTVDGYSSSDIKQGGNGDCWWLAAVATIAHRKELMDKACVIRDEEVGVYGFVFYRDGEWISTVVDDNLYLTYSDFDYYGDTYDSTGKRAREFRKRYQTGSEALYFAKCDDPNETWLPLLEKAYAKVHGDYESISGGYPGEAVEDMTGGVSTTVASNRVLRKDKLWKELVNADGEFVFALSALGTGWDWKKGGLALGHAYSILKATEEVDENGNKVRLVQVRNPWGERASNGIGEWNGPWSDGSKEWTPYWLKKLNHTFGDDGVFWMSYQDVLETFKFIHRTRLFDEKWTVVQQWTSVNVGWVSGYLNKKFVIEVKKAGTVVIVLTQLDTRYFVGFEGQYEFALHFLLQEVGNDEHICRVRPVHDWENRSVSCEVDLEPGTYEVLPKITATRYEYGKMVEDVVREWADKNPSKLRQVGMQYDLAHAKGGIPDEDEILSKKKEEEKKKKEEKEKKEKAKKEKAKAKKEREKAKKRREKEKAKKAAKTTTTTVTMTVESTDGATVETKTDGKVVDEKKDDAKDDDKDEKFEDAVEAKTEEPAKEEEKKDEKKDEKKEEPKKEDAAPKSEKPSAESTPGENTPESTVQGEAPAAEAEEEEEEEEEDDDEEEEEEKKEEKVPPVADDEERTPWNAVCVMGLRVYARDPEVTVRLAEPKNEEEASSLVMDGKSVGATM